MQDPPTRRCRALRQLPQWPAGLQQPLCSSLHARATAANGSGAFARLGRVRGARQAAAAAHGATEGRPSGRIACVGMHVPISAREIRGAGSPEWL
mmetsp:Transcript_36135/g.71837  ORF Transcript_36135/g.71837 Transcript_36135/m.71837 type:complete len:95 (-) Transcript_36135:244-528(-)